MDFVGYMATPTNRPVVSKFQEALKKPSSDDDDVIGVFVDAKTVRNNVEAFDNIPISGVVELRTDMVTVDKSMYASMVQKLPATSEQLLRFQQQSEVVHAELEAKVLNLQQDLAEEKSARVNLQQELADEKAIGHLQAQEFHSFRAEPNAKFDKLNELLKK